MFVSLFSVFNPTANAVPITLEKNWSSVASSSDGTKIVAVANGGKIYISSDSGATWSAKESDRGWRSVASSADGTKLVAVDGGGKIYISSDSGATWSAKESDRNWNSVASSADGTKLFATVGGGQIYVSYDSGATWSAKAINKAWTSISTTADGTKLIATSSYTSQVYESYDSGLTWAANASTFPNDWLTSATSATTGQKLSSASGHIYFSYYSDYYGFDVYEEFANQPGVVDPTWGPGGTWVSLASSADGTKLVALDRGGQIWITNDSGANWSAKESNREWQSVASSADGTKLVAAVGNGPIFISSNSGETWTAVTVEIAIADGTYDCNTGLITTNDTNYFTVLESVVTGHTGCVGLVNIPNGVTSIGEYALNGVAITSVNIPDSVTSIQLGAFSDSGLTSVTIPDSVITIGNDAFYYNIYLTSVTIGNSVTSIGNGAFDTMDALTSLTIGNRVSSIGTWNFYGSLLTSVTIPASVTSIDSNAFTNSDFLETFTFLGNAPAVTDDTFIEIADGATANVAYNATGFDLDEEGLWKGLMVVYGNPPSNDSGSSSPLVITPTVVDAPDALINSKNEKSLSKREIKKTLDKNKTFKNYPIDKYKYSIFGTSKKTCAINGNFVVALKDSGACEMWVTRTTAKGKNYKYWVKINYLK